MTAKNKKVALKQKAVFSAKVETKPAKKAEVKKAKVIAKAVEPVAAVTPEPKKAVAAKERWKNTPVHSGHHNQVNTTDFIVGDAPMPAVKRSLRKGQSRYPFAMMNVGQTFFVPVAIERALYVSVEEADAAEREELARTSNRLSGAARSFSKNAEGYRFSIVVGRDEASNSVGVWVGRVATKVA